MSDFYATCAEGDLDMSAANKEFRVARKRHSLHVIQASGISDLRHKQEDSGQRMICASLPMGADDSARGFDCPGLM
jgi:hypothetical protein